MAFIQSFSNIILAYKMKNNHSQNTYYKFISSIYTYISCKSCTIHFDIMQTCRIRRK